MKHLISRLGSVACAGLFVLAWATQASAGPILQEQFQLLGNGTYQYTYTLTDNDPADDIYDFSLPGFAGDPTNYLSDGSPGDPASDKVFAPTGWFSLPGYDPSTNTGFVNWFSTDPLFDVVPNVPLTFTLLSAFGPGAIQYTLLDFNHTDPVLGGPLTISGTTTGPVQGVPEPSTGLLLAAGFGFLWSQRRKTSLT